jgi:hypothetical protein
VSSAARRQPRDGRRLALVGEPSAPGPASSSSDRAAGGLVLIFSLGASIVSATILFTFARM